jgi:hypothetical protein
MNTIKFASTKETMVAMSTMLDMMPRANTQAAATWERAN